MPFDEDPAEFLDETEHATRATYDGATEVLGIFTNAYAESQLGLVGVGGTEPRFVCAAADVDADPAGKSLVIGDDTWTIVRGEPFSRTWTRLVLRGA